MQWIVIFCLLLWAIPASAQHEGTRALHESNHSRYANDVVVLGESNTVKSSKPVHTLFLVVMEKTTGSDAFTQTLASELQDYGYRFTQDKSKADAFLVIDFQNSDSNKIGQPGKDSTANWTDDYRSQMVVSNAQVRVLVKDPELGTLWSHTSNEIRPKKSARKVAKDMVHALKQSQ